MIDYRNACEILELEDGFDIDQLKQQYRIKALRYHPDKNGGSQEATEKFQSINESYEYLKSRIELCDRDDEPISEDGYQGALYAFIKNMMKNDSVEEIVNILLRKITNICEKNALAMLEKVDKRVLLKINEFIKKYREAFHFSEEFFKNVEELTKNKCKEDEYIILHPTLQDLLNDNIYRLRHEGHIYNVPLWHNDLLYDNSGNDVYVKCYPLLPENMSLDSDNNLHVNLEYKISEIFGISEIDVFENIITFNSADMRLIESQNLIMQRKGASKINTSDVYNVSKRADIILNIRLFM